MVGLKSTSKYVLSSIQIIIEKVDKTINDRTVCYSTQFWRCPLTLNPKQSQQTKSVFFVQTHWEKDQIISLSIKTHQINENWKLLCLLLQTRLICLYSCHSWKKCNHHFMKIENITNSQLFESHCWNILWKLWWKKVSYHSLKNHCN